MKKYTLRGDVKLTQIIDEADIPMWEEASPETRERFLGAMERDLHDQMRGELGETGEVTVRVWMEEEEVEENDTDRAE